MLATSDALTVVSFFSLRMRPEALRPVKWRLAVCPRKIFPVAVTLKRLRAPRCVFNFIFGFEAFLGIARILSHSNEDGLTRLSLQNPICAVKRALTATAARQQPLVRRTWGSKRLSSGPAGLPERCLPSGASFRSAPDLQFPCAGGPSWRGPLPGAPF